MAARHARSAMGGSEIMTVIGIGTTSRVTVQNVLAIVAAARAKAQSALQVSRPAPFATESWGEGQFIQRVASLDRASVNPVLQYAAEALGLDLVLLSLDELQAAVPFCVTRSEKSMQRYGIPSIAEAAALVAAGTGRLLVPRFCGPNATASVAIHR